MQNSKELWISRIYFPMENLMDRVQARGLAAWLGSSVDRGSVDKRAW
jgi:hypothetical protein